MKTIERNSLLRSLSLSKLPVIEPAETSVVEPAETSVVEPVETSVVEPAETQLSIINYQLSIICSLYSSSAGSCPFFHLLLDAFEIGEDIDMEWTSSDGRTFYIAVESRADNDPRLIIEQVVDDLTFETPETIKIRDAWEREIIAEIKQRERDYEDIKQTEEYLLTIK